MVLPDRTRFQQDRSRGLIREIHHTLAAAPRVHRNLPGSDYRALLERPDALHLPAQDGYLLGLPTGATSASTSSSRRSSHSAAN